MRSNASWVMVTWGPPSPREQKDTSENITLPQLRWQAVISDIMNDIEQLCHKPDGLFA